MLRLIFFLMSAIFVVEMFFQDDYTIVYERLEVSRYDRAHMIDIKTRNLKYNRTAAASNYSGTITMDVGMDVEVHIEAARWASNEYRHFPMVFKFNFCSAVANNDFGLKRLYTCGNFSKCPMVKGHFVVCNFRPDEKRFPPHIPDGSYKIDMKFMYFGIELQCLEFYGTVKRPIVNSVW